MGFCNRTTVLKVADATLGAASCLALGVSDFLGGAEGPAPVIDPAAVRRVLVIRPGGLGDMVLLLPVLRALRAGLPQAEMDLVCERRNVDVLALAGLAQAALVYDRRPWHFLRALRRRAYDVVIDTEQFHNFSAVFARLSGAPVRIGYKISPRRNLLYTHLVGYALDGPEGAQFARLLGPLGITGPVPSHAGCLRAADAPPGRGDTVVIHAGASTAYKVWRVERFVELAVRLGTERGLRTVCVGGRADAARAGRIGAGIRAAGGAAESLAGGLDLAGTAGVIRDAALFVGPDSGLAHLAVAEGTPTVVLFGPSDPAKWGFEGDRHCIVREPQPCSPCAMFGYYKLCRTVACMEGIVVERVWRGCEDVLRGGAAPSPLA